MEKLSADCLFLLNYAKIPKSVFLTTPRDKKFFFFSLNFHYLPYFGRTLWLEINIFKHEFSFREEVLSYESLYIIIFLFLFDGNYFTISMKHIFQSSKRST